VTQSKPAGSLPKPQELPQARGHIAALDGVRGLAIALVLMQHLGGGRQSHLLAVRLIADAMRLGWTGVSLFFVLSGFLITGILWDSIGKPAWWRRFYARRSLRIFPLYFAALAYSAVIGRIWQPDLLHRLWVYVLYLQNILPFLSVAEAMPRNRVILDHFWSLAVEEQFYLVWPFILLLLYGRRVAAMRLCLLIWIASFALRLGMALHHFPEPWLYRFPLSRAGELCMGGFLALSLRGTMEEAARILFWARRSFLPTTAALVALAIFTHGDFSTANDFWTTAGIFLLPVLFASAIAVSLSPGLLQRVFTLAFLRWLGKISYGVYVYHLLLRPVFIFAAAHLLPRAGEMMQELAVSILSITGTLLIATLSFSAFERPLLRLKRRFPIRMQPAESIPWVDPRSSPLLSGEEPV
jgi:peptidoglycan/LPS O-acetylase OafA/YrhL